MIIQDFWSILLDKIGAMSQEGCVAPNFGNNAAGKLSRIAFSVEAGIFGAHQVYQNSIISGVVGKVFVFGPVLRSVAPPDLGVVTSYGKLGLPIIFPIKEN